MCFKTFTSTLISSASKQFCRLEVILFFRLSIDRLTFKANEKKTDKNQVKDLTKVHLGLSFFTLCQTRRLFSNWPSSWKISARMQSPWKSSCRHFRTLWMSSRASFGFWSISWNFALVQKLIFIRNFDVCNSNVLSPQSEAFDDVGVGKLFLPLQFISF